MCELSERRPRLDRRSQPDPLDLVCRHERLAKLLDRVLLTRVDYSKAKARILAGERASGIIRASSVGRSRMPYRHMDVGPRYVGRELVTLSEVRLQRLHVDGQGTAELQLEVGPGDEVRPLVWNEDKVGHVIARGATATEAIAHGRRLAAAIHVRTEPVA